MTTNQQLKALMDEHSLDPERVAFVLDVSPWTVKSWLRPETSKAARKCPSMALTALLASLRD